MITTKQRVLVAKDRALDDLSDLVRSNHGYLHFDDENKRLVNRIATLLCMVNSDPATLVFAKHIGYINGEEEVFFEGGK